MAIRKRIFDIQGNLVDLTNVQRGDRMVIALTMAPERRPRAQYIIADLLPAGFEIETVLRPEDAGNTGPYSFLGTLDRAKIAEARDDRFVAAVDANGSQTKRFAYIVRAVTPGAFTLPGVIAEDMYRPDVFARSGAGRVTIRP